MIVNDDRVYDSGTAASTPYRAYLYIICIVFIASKPHSNARWYDA